MPLLELTGPLFTPLIVCWCRFTDCDQAAALTRKALKQFQEDCGITCGIQVHTKTLLRSDCIVKGALFFCPALW